MSDWLISLFLPTAIFCACAGWGALGADAARWREPLGVHACAAWGMAVIALAALLTNFFLPLGANVGVGTLLVGFAGVWRRSARDGRWLRALGLSALVCTASTALAGTMVLSYDAGLYHIPYMQWIASEPVVLGLASLEGRFGFNSIWLLIVSAFRMDFAVSWSHLIYAELAIRGAVLAWVVSRLLRAIAAGRQSLALLHAVALTVLLIFLLTMGRSTATDHSANLCVFVAWLMFSELCLARPRNPPDALPAIIGILLLVSMALVCKLSTLTMMLLPIQAAYVAGLKPGDAKRLPLLPIVGIGALLAFWMLRSIALSGCVLFPASATCLQLPWTTPLAALQDVSDAITGWARSPGKDYMAHAATLDGTWIRPWLVRTSRSVAALSIIGSAGFLIASLVVARKRGRHSESPLRGAGTWYRQSAIALAAGFSFWLLKAPDPRFAWGLFAILATMLVTAGLAQLDLPATVPPRFLKRVGWLSGGILAALLAVQFLHPIPARLPLPRPAVSRHAIGAGLDVSRPLSGDQCWVVFPCAPADAGNLEATRARGHLQIRAVVHH